MGGGTQPAYRISLGSRSGPLAPPGRRAGRRDAGPDPCQHHASLGRAASGEHDPTDGVRAGDRSDRQRLRAEPCETRRQRHRLRQFRVFNRRQVARNAEGDRARGHAGRGHLQPADGALRTGVPAAHRGGRVLIRGKADAGHSAGRRWHRSGHRGLCAHGKRRPDRAARCEHREWSRPHHRAGGPPSPARGLSLSFLCGERRSFVLWDRGGRRIPAGGSIRLPHPQRRQSGPASRAGADQIRAGDQTQNPKGARARSSGEIAGARRRGDRVKRREFITLLGGAAAWPLAARAQQTDRMRRIGVLMAMKADDPESQARLAAFAQGLQQSGWTIGQNVRVDYRWSGGNVGNMRKYAMELVALAPDVILAHSSAGAAPLLEATRTVPIVFTTVADPVGAGYVDSLARPGGNATGFVVFEYSIAAKWLELLKEIAPGVTRAAVLRESAIAAGPSQFAVIQAVAPSLGVELRVVDVRDAGEIERAITVFAQGSNSGLIVTGSPTALFHRELIVALAARHRLPAVYNGRFYVAVGGLISYGPDSVDQFRRAAA